MANLKERYQGLKAILAPIDVVGTAYALTVFGSIFSGDAKPIYLLVECLPLNLDPHIVHLEISPCPTEGPIEHEVNTLLKKYDRNPEPLKLFIQDYNGEYELEVELAPSAQVH